MKLRTLVNYCPLATLAAAFLVKASYIMPINGDLVKICILVVLFVCLHKEDTLQFAVKAWHSVLWLD